MQSLDNCSLANYLHQYRSFLAAYSYKFVLKLLKV